MYLKTVKIAEINIGDSLQIDGGVYFVDDIDKEYLDEEVAKLYQPTQEVKPEHSKHTFPPVLCDRFLCMTNYLFIYLYVFVRAMVLFVFSALCSIL